MNSEERRNYLDAAIIQLNSVFGVSGNIHPNNDELTMLVYMHILSYHFDDREPIKKSPSEMRSIAQAAFVARVSPQEKKRILVTGGKQLLDYDVGKIKSLPEKDRVRLINLERRSGKKGQKKYQLEFVKYHLRKIRDSLCHGHFIVKKDKNGNSILLIDNPIGNGGDEKHNFRCNYNFDCVCDICEMIADKEQLRRYRRVLTALKTGQQLDLANPENKLAYLDLLVNILYSYNEEEIQKDSSSIQRLLDAPGVGLTLDELRHIRHSVTHHYRKIQRNGNLDDILIVDYKDQEKTKESFRKTIPFSTILRMGKNRGNEAEIRIGGDIIPY